MVFHTNVKTFSVKYKKGAHCRWSRGLFQAVFISPLVRPPAAGTTTQSLPIDLVQADSSFLGYSLNKYITLESFKILYNIVQNNIRLL